MFELWRKRKEVSRLNRFFDAEIKKAKEEKRSSDEIDTLRKGLMADIEYIEEEIKILISQSLVRKAERLFLPVPSYYEANIWGSGNITGRWYLKPGGITELRSIIREETAARRKAFLEWINPFIGIIGATTGLLAVIITMT